VATLTGVSATVTIRPAVRADAEAIAGLFAAQREHLAPWDPRREPGFYTRAGQRARLTAVERDRAAGTAFRFLILEHGEIAGEIALSNVVRRSFQSANVGYWVARERCGRGVATAAVAALAGLAFGELDLHRLEAAALLHNTGSHIVLDRNGFRPFGIAQRYLRIAGAWSDHVLFQRVADDCAAPLGKPALARRISLLADPQ
jgi:ribosomal-protein-alanine N-acetyltransferase